MKERNSIIDEEFKIGFAKRLTELRIQKKVSAREMSLDIGQSPGYINSIENQKMSPSLPCFIIICEYLNITPSEFLSFYENNKTREELLLEGIKKLPFETIKHLELLVNDLSTNRF